MKKGQMVETVIEKIGFPNKGVGLVDGEKFVVKNALPGQKVQAVCTKLHKGKGEGRLVSVLEKAPCEKESDCPHFGICGSCLYRTLPYEEQLRIKEQQVKDLLFAAAGEFPFEGIKGSPVETGYRNKMEFSFGDEYKDGPLTLGMHKRGSFYDVVFTEGCQIVDADYRRILRAVCLYFREKQIPYYHKTHVGFLRHLLVRKAAKTGEILVDLVTSSQTPDAWNPQEFARLLTELSYEGELVGVLHTTNDSVADVILNEKTDILYGRDFFLEELLGLSFKITPFSFFQTNSLGAEVLYDTVRGYVREAMKNLTGNGSLSENVTGDGPGDVTGDGPVSHFAKCD
ncbi:MAG: class I SAM-dependent RNA methyltransferase, partial [Lachnospiraceae bacterium]|nr:class I SAM-dependent RNA methyltransferase [Lachnospiraceae bacterium]